MVTSKRIVLFTAAMALALPILALAPAPPKFSWTTSDPNGDHPRSKLYIMIAGRKTRVATVDGVPQLLDKEQYKTFQIPATAIAVSNWYAGGGDRWYAVVSGNKVYVKQSILEEQMAPSPWKTVATFSLTTGRKIK